MQTWKTLKRERVLERGKYLVVEDHAVELPDGRVIADWPYLITPDYVNVLAITPRGQAVCFRQTKYATGETLAIVGGYIEPGEDPAEAARRELREESGYESSKWTQLGSFILDANRGCGQGHLFLAQAVEPAGAIASDDLEEQQLVLLELAELDEALRQNAFKALSWAATVSLALGRLGTGTRV
jgi:ADP-ribose pyrophosphatase